jgi:succinyl-CoA synthetase beta subunit
MRLYEFEAKKIFGQYQIPVPRGTVITKDTISLLDNTAFPAIVKAQSFLGGRGKAGLVKVVQDREQAEHAIKHVLNKKHGRYPIDKILIETKIEIEQEVYICATIDRLEHRLLFMTSRFGGMEIESIAQEKPGSILKYYFNPMDKMHDFMARKIACNLEVSSSRLHLLSNIIHKVYELFITYDCKLVEINPLCLTRDGQYCALDAKIDLDEDAMYRHEELAQLDIKARHEIGELTEREKIAKARGIPYVDLDGDIGVFPGGAGFGIAALDLITLYKGRPANFMDSGGAPTQEKLRNMLGLLIDNPRVKAIFGARFGGISRCDDWAKAVVQYITENKPSKPMIMRMAGNMEEAGRKILEQAKKDHPELFRNIKIYSVSTPIEEVIKETIRIAQENK